MKTKEMALPIGSRDWANGGVRCNRVRFFEKIEARLSGIGFRPCLGFRGNISLDGWAIEAARLANNRGWGIYWHPNFDVTYGIGKNGKLNEAQIRIGALAEYFHEVCGLEYLLVHPDAMNFNGYGPQCGSERYHSVHHPAELADFFHNHIRPLQKLNQMSGGILAIENVPHVLFGQLSPDRMYTYEGEQLGGQETPEMARLIGCATCVDSEHFLCMDDPEQERGFEGSWSNDVYEWLNLSGYYIHKGFKPVKIRYKSFEQFLREMSPSILHLGGAVQLMQNGLASSHVDFDFRQKSQRQLLECQIQYVEANGGILESEVCGDDGTGWSSRSTNDWLYKKRSALKIVRAIEALQKARQ